MFHLEMLLFQVSRVRAPPPCKIKCRKSCCKNTGLMGAVGLFPWLSHTAASALISFWHLRQSILKVAAKWFSSNLKIDSIHIGESSLDLFYHEMFYFFLLKTSASGLFKGSALMKARCVLQDMQKPPETLEWANIFRERAPYLCATS